MTNKTDEKFMLRAIQLAQRAKAKTSPNPMVGSVIVRSGKILAQGWHKSCGSDHAEIDALKSCGKAAKGASLYVNLEPCYHFGRTPPCVDSIIDSGIKRVIIAHKDPSEHTNGKSIIKLKRAGIDVRVGVLKEEALLLNEVFIKYVRKKMPFVVAKSAQTLDGKIAAVNGRSKWITSKESRDFARIKRNEFDAIMVGINTVIEDDPRLNAKDNQKQIKKIVVDSALKIPLKAKLFGQTKSSDCIIATSIQAPERKINQLLNKGVDVIICPLKKGKINLKVLLKYLAKKEITSILMEGGAQLIGSALKENLVDKMNIYIAPKIFGDQKALDAIVGMNTLDVRRALFLDKITVKSLGKDIFIEGYPTRG